MPSCHGLNSKSKKEEDQGGVGPKQLYTPIFLGKKNYYYTRICYKKKNWKLYRYGPSKLNNFLHTFLLYLFLPPKSYIRPCNDAKVKI